MAEWASQGEGLDPEVRALLGLIRLEGAPRIETMSVEQARIIRAAGFKKLGGPPIELARVEGLTIPGAAGEIPARVYANEAGGLRTGLVYFHGGGYVIGDLDTHEPLCRALAKESGAVVVAVDYRRAPENRFPAAVEDAQAATVWIARNAEQLGIDARRIAVVGDSAGGGLATVVAMRCRDAARPALMAQVLLYPVMDLSSFDTDSYLAFAENHLLTRVAMQWFAGHYLGSAEDARNPEASPLLARDLSGLPPALVITAEFDPLRDEGEAYAERLAEAGTTVTITRYSGMIHGFASMLGVLERGRLAIREAAQFLRDLEG
ncbi:MAG TPA: alpha/beta hydrolase [Terracidiphilus sp.]|nr:alpha/beta hydrolase [Terracidiphilus sp.]